MKKKKDYKNFNSIIKTEQFYEPTKQHTLLRLIKEYGADALVRDGNFSTEIIWDKVAFKFPKTEKGSNFRRGLYLFSKVRSEAKLYLKKRNRIRLPIEYPVNVYNEHYRHIRSRMTATDIDHAYWRIAYQLGVISQKTYTAGLDPDFKVLRLATLSMLGRGKSYQIIRNGKKTEETVTVGADELLIKVYKLIRFTCYKYMQECAGMLGDDFVGYRTDCIYYRDTEENKKLVKQYFTKKGFKFKQLYNTKTVPRKRDGSVLVE